MSLSFDRSVRVGLTRFNFTDQGIDVSVAMPALRTGIGVRGAYISGGLGKFSYRRSIGVPLRGVVNPIGKSQSGPLAIDDDNVIATEEHETKSVLELQDSTRDELLQSMNEQFAKRPLWPLAAAGGLPLLMLLMWLGGAWPAAVHGVILTVFAVLVGWLYWRDSLGKLTVLFYEPDQATNALFEQLCGALTQAAAARKLRSIASTSRYADPKYSGGAGQGVQLGAARLVLGHAPYVVANVQVPVLISGKTTFAFYPDRVLAFQGNAVGAIDYATLSADCSSVRYIETDSVTDDATVVDKTWQYVNKKGGPDRRFKNNRELPVCDFSQLNLSTADGLDVRFVGSRQGGFESLAKALAKMKAHERLSGDSPVQVSDLDWGAERANGLFRAEGR